MGNAAGLSGSIIYWFATQITSRGPHSRDGRKVAL